MKNIYNSQVKIKNIGIRHAEKMHETLLSREERLVSKELKNYYVVPADNRDLNYNKYFSEGLKNNILEEYNSSNTIQLDEKSLSDLLEKIGYNGKDKI
jgi:UDP-glucose 4-epimerase